MKFRLLRILIFSFCFAATAVQADVIDRIVAVVGDDIVLKSEIDQYVSQKNILGFEGSEEEIRDNILEELISIKILYDIAKKDTTISVSDEEVQRILDGRINPIIQQVGGEKNFEEIYKTTVSDLKRHYRTEIRKNALVEKLKNKHHRGISVSRREIEAYYEEYKDSIPPVKPSVTLSQLVIGFSNDALAQSTAMNEINKIRTNILSGKISFENAAEIYSQDESSKIKGGNIGFTTRGDLVPEYERAAYNLNSGDISHPVKSSFGYHLIKLEEKIGERINTSHILIIPQAYIENDSTALNFAGAVRDSVLNKKMTFEEAARKHSTDEKTKYYDGLIGVMQIEDMDRKYSELFENSEIGFITEPIKEKDGYYLYKIVDKKGRHEVNIETDYNALKNYATEHKRQQELKKWIDELRKKVYIEIK